MAWTEIVAVVRDLTIIVLAVVSVAALFIVVAKVTALVDSVRRIARRVEDVTSSIAGMLGATGAGAGFWAGITQAATSFLSPQAREPGREDE